MALHVMSRHQIENGPLPGPSIVVLVSNPDVPPATIHDQSNARLTLPLQFHDIAEPMPGLREPWADDAQAVLEFLRGFGGSCQHIVFQCDAGRGRSQAMLAAWQKINGMDPMPVLAQGTYNRLLYRLMLEAAGQTLPPEPLVSIVVRVKYPRDRLDAFMLSMDRQRWNNRQIITIHGGERWGHPYRQAGIDKATGAFIGLQNDDNYLTPGFIEQLVMAMESTGTDLALCDMLTSYSGWNYISTAPIAGSCDVGCWLARAELVRKVPWEGADFDSDGKYLERLHAAAGGRAAKVNKALLVKN